VAPALEPPPVPLQGVPPLLAGVAPELDPELLELAPPEPDPEPPSACPPLTETSPWHAASAAMARSNAKGLPAIRFMSVIPTAEA
jgi:hypothetical protein